jgi:hypothetical protein
MNETGTPRPGLMGANGTATAQPLEGLASASGSALSVKLHELQTLLGKIIDTPEDWDWDWRTDARELHEELEDLLKRQPERHEATQAFVDWCPDKSAGIRQAYYHGYMDGSASWPNDQV